MSGPRMIDLGGQPHSAPKVADTAFVAAGATLAGDVTIADEASIWYGVVIRADLVGIEVGARSNIQDGSVLHADPGFPLRVGEDVTVGHRVVLHGCTIGDGCLIGMGSVVMNGAVIGAGSLVAAGAVVLEGTEVPPGSLVAGVPAKVRKELSADEQKRWRRGVEVYRELAARHATAGAGRTE